MKNSDLIWRIVRAALGNTARRQRWMPRPLLQKGALFLAVLLIAWTSGHLDEVTGKGKIAAIVAGAALLVFLVEFVWQLFVATYEAGSGASGETRRLKEMYHPHGVLRRAALG